MAKNNQKTLSPRTPHFFKIILKETLQENKLRIPHKFVRKYGETLSNRVSIKLPNGSEWKMELAKHDGEVWLKTGWPEFAKHHSIRRGAMIIFRYEGNSKFHAVICDVTTTEIDYPCVPASTNMSAGTDGESRVPEREIVEDDVVEILDGSSTRAKRAEKTPVPHSRPQKRMRTCPTAPSSRAARAKLGRPFTTKYTFRKRRVNSQPKAIVRQCGLDTVEKARILERVPFKSRKPFFKIVMQRTYIGDIPSECYLNVPRKFVREYLKNYEGDVLLVSNATAWSSHLRVTRERNGITTRIVSVGWKAFVEYNNLQVGDVCIFELVDWIKISFQVSIFRAADNYNTNRPSFQAGGSLTSGGKRVKIETD